MEYYIYDIECYPNVFTLALKSHSKGEIWVFEISDRKNQVVQLLQALNHLWLTGATMVGFNNLGYDYPMVHYLYGIGESVTPQLLYSKSHSIIYASDDDRFKNTIWPSDYIINQLDLFKIHHFDNKAKRTSLKMIEFNMRSESVQELPYEPGSILTSDEIDNLIPYNIKDVNETQSFFEMSKGAVNFREKLTVEHGRDFTNHNDTKIGKDFLIMRLEEARPGTCYENRKPRQSPRSMIPLDDIIFDYIRFERPEFNAVLNWFKNQVITETKGVFTELPESVIGAELMKYCTYKFNKKQGINICKNLNTVVEGFQYDFGTGGIHGSISKSKINTTDTHQIIDVDVTSYYPSIAIENKLYPEHLGELFCSIYADIKQQRIGFKKGTPENKMLKLALNGTYGASNDVYSPFYDPKFTMAITVNGQLMLCMLAEQMIKIPGLELIQINTDGVTVNCPRNYTDHLNEICKWWENVTSLQLEQALYKTMWIRDVNNYVALYENGKVKRKGAYEFELTDQMHKNHSSLVVQKVAFLHMVYGVDIDYTVRNWIDPFDFMLRTKVPRSSKLVYRTEGGETDQQRISRYFVSTIGGKLIKIMPPLPKNPNTWREIGINADQLVTICNHDVHTRYIDYDWYINEVKQLVIT